ncbi:ABC transporter ATP-binding protein [Clostridium butyricum]|uniref:ABC transporter ATP-binding protein n=1 Tax=Clostridium butyricum TaxID=1492 RepID=UPI00041AB116|nr:ABC transporter ATP-binding protein [Clostridium butyricum]MDU4658749.1 ABC transporter ATP-binding protein [Clostridium butyricum]MDU4802295.1 ABC transporter ATP-binding protein [Clostridium butyricum]
MSENVGRLEISNITKVFNTSDSEVKALEPINLIVKESEFVAILGSSGCGKSTLLRIIGGLEAPTTGYITVNEKKVYEPGADRGMVFQAYTLFPWLTVQENIEFGLKEKGIGKNERAKIAKEYIEIVGLKGFENSYSKALSGGMKQRVAIARALANDPKIILLDEPFGALDMQTRSLMQELLLNVWKKTKKTVILVTHDIDEAIFMADRVVVMSSHPGSIKDIIDINIPRPRDYRMKIQPKFLEYKEKAINLIREETLKVINF